MSIDRDLGNGSFIVARCRSVTQYVSQRHGEGLVLAKTNWLIFR